MGASGSKTEQPPPKQSQQRHLHDWTIYAVPPSSSLVTFFSSPNSPISRNVTSCDASSPPPLPPPPPSPDGALPPPPLPPSSSSSSSSSKSSSKSLPLDGNQQPSTTVSSSSSPEEDAIAQAAAAATIMINPGPYEQAPQDLKRLVMLDTHDGFRCDINKQLSPYMAVVHSFWLGTTMIPDGRKRTYTWLTQVADESNLYMARLDPEKLSLDGRIHKSLLGGLVVAKLQMGIVGGGNSTNGAGDGRPSTDQCLLDVDVNGPSWSGNLKYGTMGGGLVYGCSFHQGFSPNFSMGGEGMYVSANGNMITSYLLKYTMPTDPTTEDRILGNQQRLGSGQPTNNTAAAAAAAPLSSSTFLVHWAPGSPTGLPLTLNYKRIVTPNRVTLGAELGCDPFTLGATQVLLGAEFKFSRSKLQVAVDGTLKVQSVLETKLGKEPGQPSLSLSAELDHMKDEMRFGYGLSIDG